MNGGLSLAATALITVLSVAAVSHLTQGRIKQSQQAWLSSSLASIIPASHYDNAILEEQFTLTDPALGNEQPQTVYPLTLHGQWQGAALTAVAPDGYSGAINLLVVIRANHSLAGVRVLQHKETPGLGDDIELRKSDWITAFNDKSLSKLTDTLWAVKKDGGAFDQFTGATITPRAIVQSVYRILQWHESSGLLKLQQQHKSLHTSTTDAQS